MSRKNRETVEHKIYTALTTRPVKDYYADKTQCLNIIRQVLAQHRGTSFSADDIRVLLATKLPRYYSDSDTDMAEEELIYIVKPENIERVSLELFKLFKANGDN